MTPDPREEELRMRLRAAADEHRADRAAMLARIERRRTGAHSGAERSRAGFRPLAAAAALAAVMVVGVGGTWLVTDRGGSSQPDAASAPAPPTVATAPAPTASEAEPEIGPSGATGSPSPSHAPRTSAAPPTAIPDGDAPKRGWLTSDGVLDPHSNANWSQSTLTLANTAEITALNVTIRVAVTAGVRTTGSWSSVPNDKMDIAVSEQSGWLYYRFRLRPGVTMAPGSYVFAGQFNHAAGGRDLRKDTYRASASAGDSDVEVHGTFAG